MEKFIWGHYLQGHEQSKVKSRVPRLPMTIPVMKLLKRLLSDSPMTQSRKRLLWAVSCLAFHGSFRIHELLSKAEGRFDPTTTLMGSDVRFVKTKIDGVLEDILVIHLKAPRKTS